MSLARKRLHSDVDKAGDNALVRCSKRRAAVIPLKITDWEARKAQIRRNFLEDNKTLKEVRAIMRDKYGFEASQTQYDTIIELWGWRKQLKPEEWRYISLAIEKRRLEGKETAVYQNGVLVPESRLKKRTSHHTTLTQKYYSHQKIGEDCPRSIFITTPLTSPIENLPWIQFYSKWTIKLPGYIPLLDIALEPLDPTLPSHIIRDNCQATFEENLLWSELGSDNDVIEDIYAVSNQICHVGSSQSGLGILFHGQREFLPALSITTQQTSLSQDLRRVSHTLPQGYPSQLGFDVESKSCDMVLSMELDHFLKLLIYGVSNKLIQYEHYFQSGLQAWVLNTITLPIIDKLMSLKSRSIDACLEYIIKVFLRRDSLDLMRSVLAREDTLSRVVRCSPYFFHLLRKSFWDGDIEDIRFLLRDFDFQNQVIPLDYVRSSHVVRMLVREGFVDPNTLYNNFYWDNYPSDHRSSIGTPLLIAMTRKSLEVISSWIEAGAQVNLLVYTMQPGGQSQYALREDPDHAIRDERNEIEIYFDSAELVRTPLRAALDSREIVSDSVVNNALECSAQIPKVIDIGENNMRNILAITTMLIRAGARVNTSAYGQYPCFPDLEATPLQVAVMYGYPPLVKLLLQSGAEPNSGLDGGGKTALLRAVESENVEMVKLLLESGAEVDAQCLVQGVTYKTALLVAVERGLINIAKILIDAGANVGVSATDRFGRSITEVVLAMGNESEMTKLLVRHDAPERLFPTQPMRTAQIHAAILERNVSSVQIIIENHINLCEPEEAWSQIIHDTIFTGQTEILSILVRAGVVFGNICSSIHNTVIYRRGRVTPLGCAILSLDSTDQSHIPICTELAPNPQLHILSMLLDAMLDPNSRCIKYYKVATEHDTRQGSFPLSFAITNLKRHPQLLLQVVDLLLEKGVTANETPRDNIPPLSAACDLAVDAWSLEIIRKLLENGARVNVSHPETGTPLELAARHFRGDLRVVKLLLEWKADVNAPAYKVYLTYGRHSQTALQASVNSAIVHGNLDLFDFLLSKNVDVNAPGVPTTALQEAAVMSSRECHKVVERLLEAGADINAPPGAGGATALQAAAFNGNLRLVQRLLELGADVNAAPSTEYGNDCRVDSGLTALEAAAKKGRLDTVQLLVNAEADVHLSGSKRYRSAERLARRQGHDIVAGLLRSYFEGDGEVETESEGDVTVASKIMRLVSFQ